jgi:tripartite-type tricarboxylate transporter receptor subunit TctC
VGGGYDQYARILAKHMPKFIPGEPTIVVQNMTGAEGIRAANYLYNVAPQDGSVIGGLSRNNGLARFYDVANSSIQFDARKFHWLGSPQQEIGLFILNTKTGLKSIEELKGHEITASSTAHSAPTSIYARMLNAMYGTKIKVVEGYAGSQECLLAVERNEVDGHVSGGSSGAFRARIAPWLKSGATRVILQQGMVRDAAFPDIPTAIEIVSKPEDKQMFEIAFAEQVMGRPFVMPPGVPADRVKVLRDAFDKAVKDPALLEDAKTQNMEIDPVSGAEINALLDRVYAAPPDLVTRLRELAKG